MALLGWNLLRGRTPDLADGGCDSVAPGRYPQNNDSFIRASIVWGFKRSNYSWNRLLGEQARR
jgi:hypothetical protein